MGGEGGRGRGGEGFLKSTFLKRTLPGSPFLPQNSPKITCRTNGFKYKKLEIFQNLLSKFPCRGEYFVSTNFIETFVARSVKVKH